MKTRKRQITFLLLLTRVFLLIPLIFTNCSFEPHTHYWGKWDIKTAATCTTAGVGKRTCPCGAEDKTISPLGHNVLSITTQPTCTEAGKGTCSRCSTTAPAPVLAPALGHNDLNWATYNSSNGQLSCKRTGCSGGFAKVGDTGPAGGKIIYAANNGFTVTGAGSFTAYYLEAAPANHSTGVYWSSTYVNVTGATGTAIGRGKANTAAIIAAHSGDTASNNAAKAAAAYTGGGKSDWFLPSKDELNALYKARTHLGISSGWFWSSSNSDFYGSSAWGQCFASGDQIPDYAKYANLYVRAIRAF